MGNEVHFENHYLGFMAAFDASAGVIVTTPWAHFYRQGEGVEERTSCGVTWHKEPPVWLLRHLGVE
jgi:hypothetical protein